MSRPNPFLAGEPQVFSDGNTKSGVLLGAAAYHAGVSAGMTFAARMLGPGKQLESASSKQSVGPGKQMFMLFGKVGPQVMGRFGEDLGSGGPFD